MYFAVADLNPSGGEEGLVIKILQGGRVLIFAKAQYISTAVKLSLCLLPCVDVTAGTTESRETAFL